MLSVLGVLGGAGAGFDHMGARQRALRGLLAGALFGASIPDRPRAARQGGKAHLPDPEIVLVLVTTVLGVAFAALGGALRARLSSRAAANG